MAGGGALVEEEHLAVLRKGPGGVVHDVLEGVDRLAHLRHRRERLRSGADGERLLQRRAARDEVVEPAPAVETAVEPVAVHDTATTSYVVQEGDDMTSVSISWGVSSAQIRELNNLGDNDQLKPGQVIKLPADAQQ